MNTLLLIRHTETTHLAADPCSKLANDAPLSEAGQEQAQKLSKALSMYSVDLVASSLYRRTQQTANILNSLWQAKMVTAMALNEYFLRPDGSGVESVEQGFSRVSQYLLPLCELFETVAVVSHNSILSTYMTGLMNMPFNEGQGLFAKLGTSYILGRDYKKGEDKWVVRSKIEVV